MLTVDASEPIQIGDIAHAQLDVPCNPRGHLAAVVSARVKGDASLDELVRAQGIHHLQSQKEISNVLDCSVLT